MLSSPSYGSAMARFDPRHSGDKHHSLTWSLDQLWDLNASFVLTGFLKTCFYVKAIFLRNQKQIIHLKVQRLSEMILFIK